MTNKSARLMLVVSHRVYKHPKGQRYSSLFGILLDKRDIMHLTKSIIKEHMVRIEFSFFSTEISYQIFLTFAIIRRVDRVRHHGFGVVEQGLQVGQGTPDVPAPGHSNHHHRK